MAAVLPMSRHFDTGRRPGRRGPSAFVVARAPAFRVFFVLLGLLALFIQTLVIQPHIHIALSAGISRSFSAQDSGTAKPAPGVTQIPALPRDPYPAGDDPSNCPLCQEFAHFAQYTHSLVFFVAPLVFTSFRLIAPDEALPSFAAVTHMWRGRAPPVAP